MLGSIHLPNHCCPLCLSVHLLARTQTRRQGDRVICFPPTTTSTTTTVRLLDLLESLSCRLGLLRCKSIVPFFFDYFRAIGVCFNHALLHSSFLRGPLPPFTAITAARGWSPLRTAHATYTHPHARSQTHILLILRHLRPSTIPGRASLRVGKQLSRDREGCWSEILIRSSPLGRTLPLTGYSLNHPLTPRTA